MATADANPPFVFRTPPPDWRRNLAALVAAVFIGFTGFTVVMPFLPIYIQQMGETDVGRIAVWTGVALGVTPAMTASWHRRGDGWPIATAASSWCCDRSPHSLS